MPWRQFGAHLGPPGILPTSCGGTPGGLPRPRRSSGRRANRDGQAFSVSNWGLPPRHDFQSASRSLHVKSGLIHCGVPTESGFESLRLGCDKIGSDYEGSLNQEFLARGEEDFSRGARRAASREQGGAITRRGQPGSVSSGESSTGKT